MADRNQSRLADNGDFADDDPFAELTRIMGFDPREPVKPQEASSVEESSDEIVSADDFGIDLEKELMGEFGDEDSVAVSEFPIPDAATQVAQQPFDDAAAITDFDEAIASSLEEDFNFDEMVESRLAEPVAEPVSEIAPEPAQDFAPEPSQPELDRSVSFEDEAQATDPFIQTESDQFSSDDAFDDGDFDELASNDFDQAEPVEEAAPVESLIGEDFDEDMGLAMAGVDMDFTPRVTEAESSAFAADSADAENSVVADEVALSASDISDDGSRIDDSAAGDELNEPPQTIGELDAENQISQKPEAGTSLEDELNALLNRMSAPAFLAAGAHSQNSDLPSSASEDASPEEEVALADDAGQTLESPSIPPENEIPVEPMELASIDEELLEELQFAEIDPSSDDGQAGLETTNPDEAAFDEVMADDGMADAPEAETATDLAEPTSSDAAESQAGALNWLADKPAAAPEEPSRLWSRGTPFAQPQPAVAPQPVAEQPVAETPGDDDVPASQDTLLMPGAIAQTASTVYDERPDIETVEVPERVASLNDDLDIPELAFENEPHEVAGYDDLDAEFSNLITEMNSSQLTSVPTRATTYDDDAYDAGFTYKPDSSHAGDVPQQAEEIAGESNVHPDGQTQSDDFDMDAVSGDAAFAAARSDAGDDAFDYDPDLDGAEGLAGPVEASAGRYRGSRGLMIAGLFGALVVVGGLGAFAFSSGGDGEAGAPVLVKADNQPIKVKPENPGGTVIPNQDNKVYDMVANGAKPVAPEQQTLVTDAQEPVDVKAATPDVRVVGSSTSADTQAQAPVGKSEAPVGKSEDRVASAIAQADEATDANSEIIAVTPHKVRTLVVRPDGSLVPREETPQEAPKVAATEPTDPAPQNVVISSSQDQTGALSTPSADNTEEIASATAEKPATALPVARKQSTNTPQAVPVAPQRPAEQPVDIVGEVKPDQVAAIDPAAVVPASGAWSMQIASQPSVESAQTTYQNLARRYEDVLGGRAVNIVKAEIAGKGTFYRVRVAAQSRNDAVNLCTSYKAAGGNCFVSK